MFNRMYGVDCDVLSHVRINEARQFWRIKKYQDASNHNNNRRIQLFFSRSQAIIYTLLMFLYFTFDIFNEGL